MLRPRGCREVCSSPHEDQCELSGYHSELSEDPCVDFDGEDPCDVDFDGEDRVMLVTDVGSCHLSRLIRTVVPDR